MKPKEEMAVLVAQENKNFIFKNIYYFHSILEIGGIETFFYELAKKYQDRDLAIVYSYGNEKQIQRLSRYVKCIEFHNQHFICEKAFFNFNIDIIDYVDAKQYAVVIHGDYKAMVASGQLSRKFLPVHPKIDKYFGVSKQACNSFTELTGLPCTLCYNPYTPPIIKKPLIKLISATRLSIEKGYERMEKLANRLNELDIPYIWLIFTNSPKPSENPNIVFMKPRLNIKPYIQGSDFIVQLSDNEGYCYSIVEAWCLGVPAVITDLPVLKEIGANEDNSIILNFSMDNIDEAIQKMTNKKFSFNYKPKEDCWGDLLAIGPSQYKQEKQYKILVQATQEYENLGASDEELKRVPKPGDTWWTSEARADYLAGNENSFQRQFVTILEKKEIIDE